MPRLQFGAEGDGGDDNPESIYLRDSGLDTKLFCTRFGYRRSLASRIHFIGDILKLINGSFHLKIYNSYGYTLRNTEPLLDVPKRGSPIALKAEIHRQTHRVQTETKIRLEIL